VTPAANRELRLPRLLAKPDRHLDLQQLRVRVDQHDRTAVRLHHPHRLGQNAIKDLLRFQRGIDHAADAHQHFKLPQPALLRSRIPCHAQPINLIAKILNELPPNNTPLSVSPR